MRRYFLGAAVFKLACGLLLGVLFYQYYQYGDTVSYYDQAVCLNELGWASFFENVTASVSLSEPVRQVYFVRLVAVLMRFTHADYWLLSCYFSLMSFFGAFYFAHQLADWRKCLKTPAVWALLFFPSITFWSSGLLKESLAFGSLMCVCGVYVFWLKGRRVTLVQTLLCLMALFFLVIFKYYIAAVFIPILMFLTLLQVWNSTFESTLSLWQKVIRLALAMLFPSLLFFRWLSPNLTYTDVWYALERNRAAYLLASPENFVATIQAFGQPIDLILNLFYFLFSGLFRPLIFESLKFPAVLSSLENTLVVVLAVWILVVIRKKNIIWTAETLGSIAYVLVLALWLSYATPNLGTLARYKVYYMPFFLLMVWHLCAELKTPRGHG